MTRHQVPATYVHVRYHMLLWEKHITYRERSYLTNYSHEVTMNMVDILYRLDLTDD